MRRYAGRFFFAEVKREVFDRFPNLYSEPDARAIKAGVKHLLEPFGWFATFTTLANDDILKLKEVAQTPLYTALTYLSLSAARNEFNNNLQNLKQ